MRRLAFIGIAAICIALAAGSPSGAQRLEGAKAQAATDDRGYIVARRLCADCHAIERGQPTSPNMEAPTFQRVAKTPGMTRTALLVFFRTPHRMMPNLVIEGRDAEDLIDYILSLAD